MAELYVPFSWHEAIWLEAHGIAEPGDGWKMIDDGSTELGGDFPVNCSGGVLSSNPIGASGLLRFAEAANQVRGAAGEHQVDGAKVALAMAYGANSQYFSTWVVGSLHPFDWTGRPYGHTPGTSRPPRHFPDVRRPAVRPQRVSIAGAGGIAKHHD